MLVDISVSHKISTKFPKTCEDWRFVTLIIWSEYMKVIVLLIFPDGEMHLGMEVSATPSKTLSWWPVFVSAPLQNSVVCLNDFPTSRKHGNDEIQRLILK